MTQAAINYGQVLYELSIPEEKVEEAALILRTVPQRKEALCSPVVGKNSRRRIIDRVFPAEIRNFLKVLADHQSMDLAEDILKAWQARICEQKGILEASLFYVTEPEEEQLGEIKAMLCKKYGKIDVKLSLIQDLSLIGGFILRVGNVETDWSLKGRIRQLEQKIMGR